MEYYFSHDDLEYDFILSPGSDPTCIVVGYQGHKDVRIDENGDLLLELAGLSIRQLRPSVYQELNGVRHEITARYVTRGSNAIGISLGDYDRQKALVIDPVLTYSSYIGGNLHDEITGIAVDSTGFLYVTGITNSSDFPTTASAYQTAFNGQGADYDVFVMKWNPNLTDLIYSTYFGGTGMDWGYGIAVDSAGNAFVTGATKSADFPVTPGAFQTQFHNDGADVFVAKLNASGSALIYSTYLGGSDPQHRTADVAYGIAIDGVGNAYVAGDTQSNNFPTTPGAPQVSRRGISDAFITKLNSTGTGLIYSTYLGGSDGDSALKIAVDALGNAYLTGVTASADFPATSGSFQTSRNGQAADVFVTKMNSDGTGLVFSTYLGGRGFDRPAGITVDSLGHAYVTGSTESQDFPTTPASLEPSPPNGTCVYPCSQTYAFATKFSPDGSALVYSTYVGGSGGGGSGIAVDDLGNAYITGWMDAFFQGTDDAFQRSHAGSGDAFVAKLNLSGSALVYSTYLGGSSGDSGTSIAVDAAGNIYLGGQTYSTNFPVTTNAFQRSLIGGQLATDAFISKFNNVPQILSASLTGKRFVLTGRDFSGEAVILLNGSPQHTANDSQNPTGMLIAKRAGKKIPSGETVSLQVRNVDGTLSNEIGFTRP
jgi:hypothetical protein